MSCVACDDGWGVNVVYVVAAMVYCIEFLWKNFDWLEEKLKEYEEGEQLSRGLQQLRIESDL